MEANQQEPLLDVNEKDDWFWERQTVKELFRWRSGAIRPEIKVFSWSVTCLIVGLLSWVLIGTLGDAKSIYEMILDTFCFVVIAFGCICYAVLVPVTKHVRHVYTYNSVQPPADVV